MSDVTYVGSQVREFTSAPQFDGYSRVVITVSDAVEYSAGVDTGRTLTLDCPWATQAVADDILARIQGFQYQPYTASGALLDPAAELGDAVNVNNVYSGIYTMETKFGALCASTISAPSEEEIDHEFPYVPKQDRKVTRQFKQLSSEFNIQADLISAKVSKTGGDNESFGWDLDEKSMTLKSKGTPVFYASENGVDITGKITAINGKIGGFDIESDHLSYNGQEWMGTNTLGAYLGVNGWQMGKNFRVDMSGNLYAASGDFAGTVRAGNIQYGMSADGAVNYGTFNGSGITGSTISSYKLNSGVNTSLGYADFANGVFGGWNTAGWIKCNTFYINGKRYAPRKVRYLDQNGNVATIDTIVTQD